MKFLSILNPANILLAILFFISLGASIWAITIYRLTIVNPAILWCIAIIGGVIAYFLIRRFLKPTYHTFSIVLNSLVIGGGIFCVLFLFLNISYSEKVHTTEEFAMIETGTLGRSWHIRSRCNMPYAIIDFKGTKKMLTFYCDFTTAVLSSRKLRLEYSAGLFGFSVIHSQIPLK